MSCRQILAHYDAFNFSFRVDDVVCQWRTGMEVVDDVGTVFMQIADGVVIAQQVIDRGEQWTWFPGFSKDRLMFGLIGSVKKTTLDMRFQGEMCDDLIFFHGITPNEKRSWRNHCLLFAIYALKNACFSIAKGLRIFHQAPA